VLPSSLADWHQKEENLKLGESDLQGGDGDTSRPAAAPNVVFNLKITVTHQSNIHQNRK
jgi:hypothetical protein